MLGRTALGATKRRANYPNPSLTTDISVFWCVVQALAVQTGKEALAILEDGVLGGGAGPRVDIVLKEHDPPSSNAARFLQNLRSYPQFTFIPVIGAPARLTPPPLCGASTTCLLAEPGI
jgi:hypothetical protein